MLKVQDRPDLLRDEYSNAIINANGDVVKAARLRKRKKPENKQIVQLSAEVKELKNIVTMLINKINEPSV